MVAAGAGHAAVAAVKHHCAEEGGGGVWGAACRLLEPLACNAVLKGRLVEAGGVEAARV